MKIADGTDVALSEEAIRIVYASINRKNTIEAFGLRFPKRDLARSVREYKRIMRKENTQ